MDNISEQINLIDIPKLASIIQPNRPSSKDADVRKLSIDRLYVKIKSWLGDEYKDDDSRNAEEAKKDLLAVTRWPGDDGYALARALDDKGWDCNSELVDLLDDAWYTEHRVIEELTRQWVQAYQIKSPFAIGDKVRICSKNDNNGKIGQIVNISEEVAQCNVRTSEQAATSSWIINYEQLEKVEPNV